MIAHDLVAPSAAVTCATVAGAPMSCTGTAAPATVTVFLTIKDPNSGAAPPTRSP